jgi:hypothetical protein
MTVGVCGSREAIMSIDRAFLLTDMLLEDGRLSGKADENAQSSSSAAGAGSAAAFGGW